MGRGGGGRGGELSASLLVSLFPLCVLSVFLFCSLRCSLFLYIFQKTRRSFFFLIRSVSLFVLAICLYFSLVLSYSFFCLAYVSLFVSFSLPCISFFSPLLLFFLDVFRFFTSCSLYFLVFLVFLSF